MWRWSSEPGGTASERPKRPPTWRSIDPPGPPSGVAAWNRWVAWPSSACCSGENASPIAGDVPGARRATAPAGEAGAATGLERWSAQTEVLLDGLHVAASGDQG